MTGGWKVGERHNKPVVRAATSPLVSLAEVTNQAQPSFQHTDKTSEAFSTPEYCGQQLPINSWPVCYSSLRET